MKNRILNVLLIIVALVGISFGVATLLEQKPKRPKYLFYFIGDGMSFNHILGTEHYNTAMQGHETTQRLNFTQFPVHTFVTNASASNGTTDSAAAGTALATGHKTNNCYIGVDAEGKSVRSIAEAVAEAGYMVGLVTNVGINHATPSSFYAHTTDRFRIPEMVDDFLASEVDFIAGSTIMAGKGDGTDLRAGITTATLAEKVRKAGVKVETDWQRAAEVEGARVMLLGNDQEDKHIPYAIDRKEGEPSLTGFVKAAISYLERNAPKEGFFLMVESGKLDYSAHEHDAATTFHEVNELAYTVALAQEFAERHPDETLIIVTSDHETGGMSLGWDHYEVRMEQLAEQKTSILATTKRFRQMREAGQKDWADYKRVLTENLGLWSKVKVTDEEERVMRDAFENIFLKYGPLVDGLYNKNEFVTYYACRTLSHHASMKWTTQYHTGMHVPLYVEGSGEECFFDCRDNTDIPKVIARLVGVEL